MPRLPTGADPEIDSKSPGSNFSYSEYLIQIPSVDCQIIGVAQLLSKPYSRLSYILFQSMTSP
jgi:hypothetical protein